MAQAALHRILNALESLEPQELEQVGLAIQARLSPGETAPWRGAFHEALLAAGLVRRIRQPHPGPRPPRHLVEAEGRPVSETIIEERR